MIVHTLSVRNCFILGLVLMYCFSGCSSLFQGEPEQPAEPTFDELNQYISDWNETKLKVDRLSAIEDDLMLIIKEVGKSSRLKNMPPEYSNKQITDYIEAEYDSNDVISPNRQYYAAHLGLFLRKDSAIVGWDTLRTRHPKIFNRLSPLVKVIKRSDQLLYSLRVGPFDDIETINLVCDVFVKYKYKCESAKFEGDAI
jgi:hypothetical protein